ncbi:hypothetical protein [Methanobrevibacter sp. DSM 116169]|uniref:hypothetical protein n=1 Tax=Methanobrevibacter sp. DSM 116169 TaxID=3242727 RepID=UPI0038FCFC3F
MNKKILIAIIAIIAVVIIAAGAFFMLQEEPVPDFKVNGEEIEVNDTYQLADNVTQIALQGQNFTVPADYEGNLTYQAGFPKADFKNEDKYLTITAQGEGNVTDLVNQYIDMNKGLSIGNETKEGNITIIEINQGSDVISHFYYLQIGDNVYEINLYGLELNDVLSS